MCSSLNIFVHVYTPPFEKSLIDLTKSNNNQVDSAMCQQWNCQWSYQLLFACIFGYLYKSTLKWVAINARATVAVHNSQHVRITVLRGVRDGVCISGDCSESQSSFATSSWRYDDVWFKSTLIRFLFPGMQPLAVEMGMSVAVVSIHHAHPWIENVFVINSVIGSVTVVLILI